VRVALLSYGPRSGFKAPGSVKLETLLQEGAGEILLSFLAQRRQSIKIFVFRALRRLVRQKQKP